MNILTDNLDFNDRLVLWCSGVVGITAIQNFPIGNTVQHSRIWEIPFGNSGFCKAHKNGECDVTNWKSNLIAKC